MKKDIVLKEFEMSTLAWIVQNPDKTAQEIVIPGKRGGLLLLEKKDFIRFDKQKGTWAATADGKAYNRKYGSA